MNTQSSNYIPGVCNINPAEIKQRRAAGHIGLALFVILLAVMLVLDFNRLFRLALVFPALIMAIGYLQAKHKFCVGYAGSGLQHADDDDAAVAVAAEAAAQDRKRARQINLQAVGIAVVITALTLIIPS